MQSCSIFPPNCLNYEIFLNLPLLLNIVAFKPNASYSGTWRMPELEGIIKYFGLKAILQGNMEK